MLFETLKHGYIFLGCVYFGILLGIVCDLLKSILTILKHSKIFQIVFDILFSFLAVVLFFVCLNFVNIGEFRIFVLISFVFGFLIEQKTLGFLVDFVFKKVYNFLCLICSKIKQTKFFKRITGFDKRKSKKIVKNR